MAVLSLEWLMCTQDGHVKLFGVSDVQYRYCTHVPAGNINEGACL